MKITLEQLVLAGVCRDSLVKFKRLFGKEADLDEVRAKIADLKLLNWDNILMKRLADKGMLE